MGREDLKVALRSLAHRPMESGLRIAVLALGLFCFLAAYLCTSYFRNYDTEWAKAGRTYAIFEALDWPNSGLHVPFAPRTTPRLAEQLPLEMRQIEAVARYRRFREASVRTQSGVTYRRVGAADPALLDVFDFDVVAGDLHRALSTPTSAIITESAAASIFGAHGADVKDVVGKTLTVTASGTADIAIEAVIRDPPVASHLGGGVYGFYAEGIGLLVPWHVWETLAPPQVRKPNWYELTAFTYVVLPADGSLTARELDRRLPDLLTRHAPPVQGLTLSIEARPLSAIAASLLQDSLQFSRGRTWALDVLHLMMIFAATVLAVACVNFVNLQTASAAGRAREMGIRKTAGARARQVVMQDLLRTGVLVFIATAIALAAVPLLRGLVAARWQATFALPWSELRFWVVLAALVPGVTLLAGLYPALVLARVPPLEALRIGGVRAGPKLLRGVLVGSQFATATFLIAAVVVLSMQRDATRDAALGRFDDRYVLLARLPEQPSLDLAVLVRKLLEEPGVKGVTATMQYPWAYTGPKQAVRRSGDDTMSTVLLDTPTVGYDYFSVMAIPVLAGRVFARSRDDTASPAARLLPGEQAAAPIKVVLDRRAARSLGWADPIAAVGERFFSPASEHPWEIIGVVENAPISILRTGSDGALYQLNPAQAQFAIVRVAKDDLAASLAGIDDVLTRVGSGRPSMRRGPFLDQAFEALYRQYAMISTVITSLGALAIAIACVGLLGLASEVAARRTREVAVRKSLGARSTQILRLLLLDFMKPVLIANVIAWPFIFFAAERYMHAFAVRVDLTPLPFSIALAVTLAVSVVAVGGRVLHAASIRPADALRYE
jgi:putative ABC transport system permease protein